MGRPTLVLALGLALVACRDDGGDEGAAGSSGGMASGSGETGNADETGTTDEAGTADQTGTDETGEDVGPWGNLDERPCPDDSFLSYENFGGPFMLTYCTTCHASRLPADMRQGSPIEVNFDDLEDIRAWDDRIWVRAADGNSTMPPVGAGDEDERALLGEWLACGAPADADLGQ